MPEDVAQPPAATSASGPSRPPAPDHHEHTVIETLQSLVLAFVLAMTFRGFVTEGFVIPTGSMAPTLMGRHLLAHSRQTGLTFPVGVDENIQSLDSPRLQDPMLGPGYEVLALNGSNQRSRMGDRILVLKTIYPFAEPDRFDVVVFKNPTNPSGEDGNYIKRLVGLPNESILLIDGDVFVTSADEKDDFDSYRIQRKREHTQRAVWQPVAHSDYIPMNLTQLWSRTRPVEYGGPIWAGDQWKTSGVRALRCDTADPTVLEWNGAERRVDDWTSYNQLIPLSTSEDVSDVRVAAAIVPDADGLQVTFELEARSHVLQFVLADGFATLRMRPVEGDVNEWVATDAVEIPPFRAGTVMNAEFWHVDQRLSLFIDGDLVVELPYEWTIRKRLQAATGLARVEDFTMLLARPALPPSMRWWFEGAPVTLHRVRVDRDLFYRQDLFRGGGRRNPPHPDHEDLVILRSPAFGTHVDKPAVLGPDQFFMLGDNSPASLDSRRWGSPHPVVAEQIDPMPFLVHRRLLLGKAWVVYFPAPYRLGDPGKWPIVPDFGRLRFIR